MLHCGNNFHGDSFAKFSAMQTVSIVTVSQSSVAKPYRNPQVLSSALFFVWDTTASSPRVPKLFSYFGLDFELFYRIYR